MTFTAPALALVGVSSDATPIARSAYPSPLKSVFSGTASAVWLKIPTIHKGMAAPVAKTLIRKRLLRDVFLIKICWEIAIYQVVWKIHRYLRRPMRRYIAGMWVAGCRKIRHTI